MASAVPSKEYTEDNEKLMNMRIINISLFKKEKQNIMHL